jgi:hypothetical protein
MITYSVSTFADGVETTKTALASTLVITGASLAETSTGLPHLRIAPRVAKGLTLTDTQVTGEAMSTQKIGVKLQTVGGVTQGLDFIADTATGKTQESFLVLKLGTNLSFNATTGAIDATGGGGSALTLKNQGTTLTFTPSLSNGVRLDGDDHDRRGEHQHRKQSGAARCERQLQRGHDYRSAVGQRDDGHNVADVAYDQRYQLQRIEQHYDYGQHAQRLDGGDVSDRRNVQWIGADHVFGGRDERE